MPSARPHSSVREPVRASRLGLGFAVCLAALALAGCQGRGGPGDITGSIPDYRDVDRQPLPDSQTASLPDENDSTALPPLEDSPRGPSLPPAAAIGKKTSAEITALQVFLDRPNTVLSRDHLISRLHGRDAGPFDRAVDVQIGRLRRKLEADPARPSLIKSVRGAGYLFAAKPQRG